MTLEFNAIKQGTQITVVFEGTTPDLACRFQRFLSFPDKLGSTLIVTTPPSETNPDLATTHYIDDYQYIQAGTPAVVSGINVEIGDSVEVRFAVGAMGTVTGILTGYEPSNGIVQITDGLDLYAFKDWHYIKKL